MDTPPLNTHPQAGQNLTSTIRERSHSPALVWFTGLSGAGKTTTATAVRKRLLAAGYSVVLLDGDELRRGLCADLGFSVADRRENLRRSTEVAKFLMSNGAIVLACFISPFREDRQNIRTQFSQSKFIEVFVDVPLEVCEQRDPKGLYRRARAGEITNFTGIDSPYEAPHQPDVRLPLATLDLEAAVETVLGALTLRGIIHL